MAGVPTRIADLAEVLGTSTTTTQALMGRAKAMPKLSDTTPRQCPCHSGRRYAACCRPMHRAEREAPTPEALMRSRYAAYSLGLGDYLVNTLAEAHPDRAVPHDQLARSLSRAR